jgi:hypothetical protein
MVRRPRPLLARLVAATLIAAASGPAVSRADLWALPPEGACARSERLRGWPIGEDAPPLLFETGDVIETERRERVRDYLPPEIWEHRERFFFEGMRLEIGPCFRDYSPPEFFRAATEKFRGSVKLLANGGVEGRVAGLPFPPDTIDPNDSEAGQKWAWNFQARYRAGGMRGKFRTSDLLGRIGRAEPFIGEMFLNQLAHRADRPDDGYRVPKTDPRVWLMGGRFFMPWSAREYAWLQFRDPASDSDSRYGDEIQVYIPELRKVRRFGAFDLEGLHMPSFSVGVGWAGQQAVGAAAPLDPSLPDSITPRRSGFESMQSRPILYRYRLLGLHDVLAPINSLTPAYPTHEERSFGPWGVSWASDRWELRRTLVLEGKKRGAVEDDEAAVKRLWIDLQTLQPLYYVSYDKRGGQIDVGYFVGRWSEDRDDYPRWPDDPDRSVRVIDSAGAAFANLKLKGSWRRESWEMVSIPVSDREVRKSLSLRNLQKGR